MNKGYVYADGMLLVPSARALEQYNELKEAVRTHMGAIVLASGRSIHVGMLVRQKLYVSDNETPFAIVTGLEYNISTQNIVVWHKHLTGCSGSRSIDCRGDNLLETFDLLDMVREVEAIVPNSVGRRIADAK
jgi:hypothetical protein